MDNPYITNATQTMADQQINPFMQNIQNQNALKSQLMQVPQTQSMLPSFNPMAMAKALRGMEQSNGVSPMQNATAWIGSKFGRDEMQANSPEVQQMVNQYYGYNVPNNWSA